ncbi:hypothetical protein F2Q70_00026283 [Brassica cretica]|uniref:Uncharacterized protein n=1 Tax=Brassica cretica TaxID=69181 RepID=A0A8S9L562_BRACR|nr:hypothetical protein F2Q70_00026283 [Brassica cretica]
MAYGLSRSVIRILCSLGMNEVEERWIWWGALTLMQSNTTCSCSFFRLQHLLRKEWDRNVVVMDRRIRLQWLDMGVYRDKNARVVHTTHVLSLRVSRYALIFSVGIDGMILLWRKMSSIEADRGLTLALNQAAKLRFGLLDIGLYSVKVYGLNAREVGFQCEGFSVGDMDVTVWYAEMIQELSRNYSGRH